MRFNKLKWFYTVSWTSNVSDLNLVDNRSHLHLRCKLNFGDVMYVCICKQVTDSEIREICRDECVGFAEVQEKTGVASQCGKYFERANSLVEEFKHSSSFSSAA